MDRLRLILLFLLPFIFVEYLGAQTNIDTSLISPGELSYLSPFEESVFKDFFENNSKDYFLLFLCNNPSMTAEKALKYKDVFQNNIKKYKAANYMGLKEKKQVAKLYDAIHNDFLDKYTMLVPFSSIFSDRNYHCVSSSMLFALIFDEMGIPYDIRIKPSHVFLVAYPMSSYTLVETTNPTIGAVNYDQGFKNNFVKYLRDSKMIDEAEYAGKSTDQLFDEYFNKTETINKTQLAGLQYQNDALKAFSDMDFKRASADIEKSLLLNPDTLNTYLLLVAWSAYYSKLNKMDPVCATQLGKLSHFLDRGVTSDMIVTEFNLLTDKQLLSEGDTALYDLSFHTIDNMIKDSALRAELAFTYNFKRGAVLENNLNYEEGLPFIEKALELKPNNVDAMNILRNSLHMVTEYESPEKSLSIVDDIAGKLPLLNEDQAFYQIRLSMYLQMIDVSFHKKDVKSGEAFMSAFESLYPQRDPRYTFVEYLVEKAYGNAALYYFGRGQTSRSRTVVEKGLEYAPKSYDLKNKLNVLK